jgi:hypothetical protein
MPIFGAMSGGVTIKPLSGLYPISPALDSDGTGGPAIPPTGPTSFVLLNDGSSYVLLNDGTSRVGLNQA